jgi:hypothetical protein
MSQTIDYTLLKDPTVIDRVEDDLEDPQGATHIVVGHFLQ